MRLHNISHKWIIVTKYKFQFWSSQYDLNHNNSENLDYLKNVKYVPASTEEVDCLVQIKVHVSVKVSLKQLLDVCNFFQILSI